MSWPATVAPGQSATANQYNAAVSGLQLWGGDVDGGGYTLKNCKGVTLAANGSLDLSAGGASIKGSLQISSTDAVPLTIINPSSSVSLQAYIGAALHPQFRSSSGSILICSQAATITRNVRICAIEGAEEYLQPGSGRLRIVGSFDVDTDVVAGGRMTAAALTVTNPANITLGGNWTNWTPVLTPTVPMTLSGTPTVEHAYYLRIGPIVYFSLCLNAVTLAGTASGTVSISLPIAPADGFYHAVAGSVYLTTGTPGWSTLGVFVHVLNSAAVFTLAGNANFTLNTYWFRVSGFYRCA